MDRFLKSLRWGVGLTAALNFFTLELGSAKLGYVLLWQAYLLDTIIPHAPDREFPLVTIIGVFLGVPIYTSIAYFIYWRLDSRKLK
jgi:hypothetical protein